MKGDNNMKRISKLISVIIVLSMILTTVPLVSNAAVVKQTIPFNDAFSTENYVPAEEDGYTVSDGSFKVAGGQLAVSSTDGNGAFLTLDFNTISSGTLVFEYDYYCKNIAAAAAKQGLVMMYDSAGNPTLGLFASSRSENSSYYNTGTINPSWKKNVNNLNSSAWGTDAGKNNAMRFEVDLDNGKWKVFQGTKQLKTRFKEPNVAVGAEEAINEFPFISGSLGNISSIRIGVPQDDNKIDNIKVYKKITTTQTATQYEMIVGGTQQAGITFSPANETIHDMVWASSNTDVATVSDTGMITAVATGNATITATSAFYGINYSYDVSVKELATGLAIDKDDQTICIGDTVTLSASPVPATSTAGEITWESSDDSIAEVDENGVVRGIGRGTATITARGSLGFSDSITVKVVIPLTDLSISASDTTLNVGQQATFTAVITPADATEITQKWRSGNHYIATVNQDGVVTAVGEGTTEIYVSASDRIASQTVTVFADTTTSNKKPSLISFYSHDGYSFYDIADMEWAQAAVYSAVDSGALNPDSETIFGAKRNIKRDEFVSAVVKILGLANRTGGNAEALKNFTDVPEDNPYYAEVMKALELGIIQGVSETEFAPDADITRQDMTVVLANAFKVANIKTEEGSLDFADKDLIAEYADTSVRILSKMGIIVGKGENRFDPYANATRAEVAVIVDRISALR